ncbi:MAG: PaaI family thioesterase [Hyphomicrobiaceae bacterium]
MATPVSPTSPLSPDEVNRLVDETFPEIHAQGRKLRIVSVGPEQVRVTLTLDPSSLRPGGTVSGPTLFTLADFSIYAALLAHLGPKAIQAVTANLNITFLARPEPVDLYADARLIRVGRTLVYAEVGLYSVGRDVMIAHATGSYALPKSVSAPKP